MSQSLDLQQLEKQSRALFSEDGLVYIFLGALFLLLGLGFAVEELNWIGGMAALLIFPIESLRRRITYPRIGYARFNAPPGFLRGIAIFFVLAFMALFALAFVADGALRVYLPLAFSLGVTLALYFGLKSVETRRANWLLLALIPTLGLIVTWWFDDWRSATGVLFAILGFLMFVRGLHDLRAFVRRYPLLDTSNE